MGRWPPPQRLRSRRGRGRLARLVLAVVLVLVAVISASAQEAGVDAASADAMDGSVAEVTSSPPASGSATAGSTTGSTTSSEATPAVTEAPVATTAAPATDATTTTAPVVETPTPTETTPTPTTAAPVETPVPTTAAPVETPAPTTEAPTTAPVTEAPVATTTAPVPATAAPAETTAAPAATTTAPTPTTTAPAPTTTEPTPTTAAPTPTPTPSETPTPTATTAPATSTAASSSGSADSSQGSSNMYKTSDEESGAGTVAPADLTTLSPISGDSDADDATAQSNGSSSVSTSNSASASLGTSQIMLIVAGVLAAVVASLFFVRFQNKRGRVFKRARGSSQQRALDSFFRQNRVTLMASANHSASQLAFNATRTGHFTAPLTPPEEIPTTSLGPREAPPTVTAAAIRPRGRTADVIAGPSADMFSRDTTRSAMSSTRSYSNGDFDSFVGESYSGSNHSSSIYYTPSERSDSIVDSSVASTTNRSTRRFLARHMSSGGDTYRGTGRSDRSSSDFSVFNASADSIDDSQREFVSIALPSTAAESAPRRSDSYSDDGQSFGSHNSHDSRDSYDSYGVAPQSGYRVSELSEGEI